MKHLKVNLWGQEIGRLVWESATRRIYFMYNPNLNNIPDIAPLLSSTKNRNNLLPIYGDDRPLYQSLPPFIADSLPDSWGNTLFDKWIKDSKISRNKITPLYKLTFIGKRGMGALEYEPGVTDLNHTKSIDIKSLYELAIKILDDRESIELNANEELTLQALLAVGSSAGGRQMKAVIALNDETGEIRSGQTDGLKGFDYYILKFGDKSMPIAEIETTFYNMAKQAGIDMEECRLFPVEGINHFLTRRFDRKNGKKIHVQTLSAMNPEARSYEELIATCRELSLPESTINEIYRRMVFNVMANNTDDHHKNFSFLLEEDGKWRLAPAYDVTFIFNMNGTGPNIGRRLSIGGKIDEISKVDLLEFARQNEIMNAEAIINRVAEAIAAFENYAEITGITQPWRGIIQKTLDNTLAEFGYKNKVESKQTFIDNSGREVNNFAVSINSKGHYVISATINGKVCRRFIRQNHPLYDELNQRDMFNLPDNYRINLIQQLFPNKM